MKPDNLLINYEDVPEKLPMTIKRILSEPNGTRTFNTKLKNLKKAIDDGLTTLQAVCLIFEITESTAIIWRQTAVKELEKGKTSTPLIHIFSAGSKSEYELLRKLKRKRLDKIMDEDNETLLRDAIKSYETINTKNELEINTPEDKELKILVSKKIEDNDDEK